MQNNQQNIVPCKDVTHLDKLEYNTKIISEEAFSSSVLNRDPFVFRGSAVSRVWTASPGENPPAGLPLLPALLHPDHPRATRRAPQEPLHLLISINYAKVGARAWAGPQLQAEMSATN